MPASPLLTWAWPGASQLDWTWTAPSRTTHLTRPLQKRNYRASLAQWIMQHSLFTFLRTLTKPFKSCTSPSPITQLCMESSTRPPPRPVMGPLPVWHECYVTGIRMGQPGCTYCSIPWTTTPRTRSPALAFNFTTHARHGSPILLPLAPLGYLALAPPMPRSAEVFVDKARANVALTPHITRKWTRNGVFTSLLPPLPDNRIRHPRPPNRLLL